MRQFVFGNLSGCDGMLRVTKPGILQYEFCDQTVTLYHAEYEPEFQCQRVVFHGAYFDSRQTMDATITGQESERRCFLLLPSGNGRPVWNTENQIVPLQAERFCLQPGDRVLRGEGPIIACREEWSRFVPANVPDLVVVKEVSVKEWLGVVRHVEAEAEWYKRW